MRMVRGSNPRTTCCRVLRLATETITTLATIQKHHMRGSSQIRTDATTALQAELFVHSGMEPFVGWEGFEPPKPMVPDLQSDRFNRLHTNPE